MSRVRSHRGLHAFTLVELLVVIGIIALLISILLPSLARARKAANTVACLSNLKQIGLAYAMYANDNQQYIPFVYYSDPNGNWAEHRYWYHFLAPYMGVTPDVRNNDPQPIPISSIPALIRGCPEFQYNNDNRADSLNPGYGQNAHVYAPADPVWIWGAQNYPGTWMNDAPWALKKLPQITFKEHRILNGDAPHYMLTADGWGTPDVTLDPQRSIIQWCPPRDPFRHAADKEKSWANYLFFDGHAETLGMRAAAKAMVDPTGNWTPSGRE